MKIAVFHNLPSGGAKRALFLSIAHLTRTGHTVTAYLLDTTDESYMPLSKAGAMVRLFPGAADSVHLNSTSNAPPLAACFSKTKDSPILTLLKAIFSAIRVRICEPTKLRKLQSLEEAQKHIAQEINTSENEVVLVEQDRATMSPFILKYLKKPVAYFCQQPAGHYNPRGDRPMTPSRRIMSIIRGEKYIVEIDKANASSTGYILANSIFSRNRILSSYGIEPHVCYLGVDTSIFHPLSLKKLDFVISVGMCRPGKGFDFLIRALSKIDLSQRPKLILVSNRSMLIWKCYLWILALLLRVNIEMKDSVLDEELAKLYNQARLFLYAPRSEPFGLVALEAMSCGTPVVATAEGGPLESINDQVTGRLVKRDVLVFAKTISEILTNNSTMNKMGANCIKHVADYWSKEHAGERLLQHLLAAESRQSTNKLEHNSKDSS